LGREKWVVAMAAVVAVGYILPPKKNTAY